MKSIAVLTSGGDAPGMNAAIRAVTRYALVNGVEVYGIRRGYCGLIEDEFVELQLSSVANLIQRGGTTLLTARSEEFRTPEGRKKAATNLKKRDIDGLVVIGGDGSFRGAQKLSEEHKVKVVGVPGTIDNDIYGTEATIGFDTAINTALEAIDRIRDTASAHERTFIVEVMGRDCGEIALYVGVGGGAEVISIPEKPTSVLEMAEAVRYSLKRGKLGSLIVVSEAGKPGHSYELAKKLEAEVKSPVRVVVLGHIQRGGTPTARDRAIASALGIGSVRRLIAGRSDLMVGIKGDLVVDTPLSEVVSKKKEIRLDYYEMAQILSK